MLVNSMLCFYRATVMRIHCSKVNTWLLFDRSLFVRSKAVQDLVLVLVAEEEKVA